MNINNMNLNMNIYKICITLITLSLMSSCNNYEKKSNLPHNTGEVVSEVMNAKVEDDKLSYKYYDVFDMNPAEVIIPKNQTIAQGLSILVTDNNENIIVFDGGRVEDSDYLCEIIKDKGGIVSTWYITHIHDDHLGALYDILSKKRTDITIKEIAYQFADFDWYYNKMGADAGIVKLFENAIIEYNAYLVSIGREQIKVEDNILSSDKRARAYLHRDDNGKLISDINVFAINDNVYKLDQDPINNTSVVYYIDIEKNINDTKLKESIGMVVFGDLGFEGGNKLFNYIDEFEDGFKRIYNADILVLSHHGQNGIDPVLYKKLKPKVIIWPTSKDIYANTHGRYLTNETKKVLSEMDSILYEFKSYEETVIIR